MVGALTRQLVEWEGDPAITRVIVTAAGERAFSAGGDLRALFDSGAPGTTRPRWPIGAPNTRSMP